jgi:FkbM family methyltransferase
LWSTIPVYIAFPGTREPSMPYDLPLPFELGKTDFSSHAFESWLGEARSRRQDLKPLDRPQILIGAGSVLAQDFVQACLDHGRVIALVDNTTAGQSRDGVPIIGDAGLKSLLARTPDAIGVLCCGSEGAIAHFTAVWGDAAQPLLGYFEVIAHSPTLFAGERLGFLPSFSTHEGVVAAHTAARAALKDSLSLVTLDAIMLHRLTWDSRYIAAVAKPEKAIYFEPDVMPLHDREVFIDGGAFDGDTVRAFHTATHGKYAHVHAFELDPTNADLFAARVTLPQVTLHRLGLWNEKARLGLEHRPDNGSRVSDKATQYAELDALDNVDIGPATLIKLDVEGAEVQALKGATNVIRQHKPKLAISAYHKSDDFVTIINAIRGIRDDYTFTLRHYSPMIFDSVLYGL